MDYFMDVGAALRRDSTPAKRKLTVPRLQQRQAWLRQQGRPSGELRAERSRRTDVAEGARAREASGGDEPRPSGKKAAKR